MTEQREDAIKVLSVMHLGYSDRVRNACETAIKGLTKLDSLEEENKALRLLLEWATECDFGYDNFPEEYEKYKEEIEGMDYREGMIYIAKQETKNRE